MLGCCNNFLKCSEAGKCIYEGDPNFHGLFNYNECLYKENLDKGLNFYTEYNVNNRLRTEEYRAKIEVVKKENEKIDKKHEFDNKKNKEKNEKQKDSSSNEVLHGQISFFDIEDNFKIPTGKERTINKSRYINNIELIKHTKIDRVCSCCRTIIKAGNNPYYMSICDIETAPYIEVTCIECAEKQEQKRIS